MAEAQPIRCSASFPDVDAAAAVLSAWRRAGPEAARQALNTALIAEQAEATPTGPLLRELQARLAGERGPRLLIDGLWFSRPHGGISRVWEQILSTWQLTGLVSEAAPVAIIDRDSHLSLTAAFPCLEAASVDPLDPQAVAALAAENAQCVRRWRADVFCSSWISHSGALTSDASATTCPELALVHDCLPERFRPDQPALMALRRRWWSGAAGHLAVSAATAADLAQLLHRPADQIAWCHLAPAPVFVESAAAEGAQQLWGRLQRQAALPERFVLLPATSAVGSYKNPELLAEALSAPSLVGLPLVLCGIAAEQRAQELEARYPHLRGRIHAAGFTDPELALVYRQALAVVIPSRIEGFGLPAIEVMAAGGLPLVADARGLREAGGEAALRFSPDQPRELSAMLELLAEPRDRAWLQQRLRGRIQRRLARLHPDLIGLALLAQARFAARRG
ncbi:glycosyltransferase [Synechococcus sp. BS55D]|uniref:glycosyltransferase n=1 Tax=Synechococcus sp. BS55D TaxID=2055943 RepID=UPI00103DF80F|nr:glycosyltransferase [Synechococcus sp. BS55D]TCD58138.1 hypothetical protein CWE16_02230 [Synechococcus sp. BS55D]